MSHAPNDGIHVRPGTPFSGNRIRLCGGSESTAATQPSWSTANAGRPIRARIGAATVRSRFRVRSWASRRWDSASLATRSTSATVVGCTVAAGPETSTMPITWPVRGILDRGSRAGPRVVAAQEMLGGEDLHRSMGYQRRADRVGSDRVLTPGGPLDESKPVRTAEHARRPGPPQDPAAGIGDHQDVLAIVDHRLQSAGYVVEHCQQSRLLAQHVQPAGVDVGRRVMFGVNTLGDQPIPRVRDDRPGPGGRTVARHGRVVHRRQQHGVAPRIITDRRPRAQVQVDRTSQLIVLPVTSRRQNAQCSPVHQPAVDQSRLTSHVVRIRAGKVRHKTGHIVGRLGAS